MSTPKAGPWRRIRLWIADGAEFVEELPFPMPQRTTPIAGHTEENRGQSDLKEKSSPAARQMKLGYTHPTATTT